MTGCTKNPRLQVKGYDWETGNHNRVDVYFVLRVVCVHVLSMLYSIFVVFTINVRSVQEQTNVLIVGRFG